MSLIPSQRHLFDIPDDIAYLNCAYMSPLMNAAVKAGKAGIRDKANPWTLSPQDFFTRSENTRALAGKIIGATADTMTIVPSVSYATATAAQSLPFERGQTILALEEQFPSNIYIWKELAHAKGGVLKLLPKPADNDWTRVVLEAIDNKTGIVALPNCHWTDGSLLDLVAIGKRAREVGAALVLDLAQSAGALPISMAEIDPDFAVYPTYKWGMGPYSLGFMYVAERWHDAGIPLEQTWLGRRDSEDFAGLVNYKVDFQPGARRYDMGQRANFQLLPMAEAALEQLLDWGIENIQETLKDRNEGIIDRAADIGLAAAPDHLRAGHYLGLQFPGELPDRLVERLAQNEVYVSVRGKCLRITPHLYNNDDDIDRLFEALA